MKISIVSGFFLPVPAVNGGATEKAWARLGEEFVAAGHHVTLYSRAWADFPNRETVGGVHYRRVPGFRHSSILVLNLIKDWIWGRRITRLLEPADVVVINTVSLPVWLGRKRPDAGKVVITTGRVPKGQFRWYRDVALIVVNSRPVLKKIVAENPALQGVSQLYGFPLDFAKMAGTPRPPAPSDTSGAPNGPVRLGFIGRIHAEKGIAQLMGALRLLAAQTALPPWHLTLCGPVAVSMGGSGERFLQAQLQRLEGVVPPESIEVLPPEFDPEKLARIYRSLDVFVLPSLAENGETFGVANLEAMAAGCAVVTSQLECFADYIDAGTNALTYDHRSENAESQLAARLAQLITDPARRARLAAAAQPTAARYDFKTYSDRLLADFARITTASNQAEP